MRRLAQALRRGLPVEPGEGGRLGGLLLHSLCNGLFCAFFFSTALSTFLEQFGADLLPFAYIGSALVGYAAVSLYAGLAGRLPTRVRLAAPLVTVLAAALGLWLVAVRTASPWVPFALMVAAGPVIALVDLEFWGLATHLFDLRQGKRLFGLVGAGEVVAATVGFFLVPLLVPALGGPVHLLPVGAAGLLGSLAVMAWAVGRAAPGSRVAAGRRRAAAAVPLSDRYFRLLALLVALFVTVLYLVDFTFLDRVSHLFAGNGAAAAQFFGVFFGLEKICELLLKTLLANRLISRFGLRAGLLALPATLAVCLLGVGAIGVVAGQAGNLFFALVALTKLVWLALWRALYEPSYRVLYQPLPPERQLAFQGRVEGTVRQAVTLLVGVGLVLHAAREAGPLVLIAVLLPAVLAWLAVVARVYREYRSRLIEAVAEERGVLAEEPSREPGDAVVELLLGARPEGLGVALDVLARVDPEGSVARLETLLARGGPAHQDAALEQIAHHRLLAALPAVEALAGPGGRPAAAAAARALCELRDLAASPERLAALARSALPAERELAAMALRWSGGAGHDELAELLWDKGWNVRRAALLAAGRLGIAEFRPRIVANLVSPAFANAAVAAAALAGEPMLPELEIALGRAHSTYLRLRILDVYERIGGPAVLPLFAEQLLSPAAAVQERALAWLARARYRAPREQRPVFKRQVEDLVERTSWDLAAIVDLAEEPAAAAVRASLGEEVERARRRLVLLLSLLYDPRVIARVQESLASGSSEAAVYALEVMDLAVSPDLRPLVLPLMEDLPAARRLRRLEALAPQPRMAPPARLAALLHREPDRVGSWTKAFAVEALGALARGDVPDDLLAVLFHPDPMLQEVAAWTLLRLDRDAYARNLRRLSLPDQTRLERILRADGAGEEAGAQWATRAIFGRAVHLRGVPALGHLPWDVLTALGANSDERRLAAGDRVPAGKDPPATLYVVVDGALAPSGGGAVAGRGETFFATRAAPWEAVGPGRLLRFDGDRTVVLAAGDQEVLLAVLGVALRGIAVDTPDASWAKAAAG